MGRWSCYALRKHSDNLSYSICEIYSNSSSEKGADLYTFECIVRAPLPLPLGEVAERSEDGEGKQ